MPNSETPVERSVSKRSILTLVLFVSVVYFVTFISGCKKPEPVVLYFYCGPAFWHLMREETAAFRQVYGVQVVMLPIQPSKAEEPEPSHRAPALWRSRPKIRSSSDPSQVMLDIRISHLISSLNDEGHKDLFLTDSVLQIDALKDSSLISRQYPFCYLKMVLLVPKGNPLKIESVRGLLEKRMKLGMMDPSIDGMGMTALEIISNTSPGISEDEALWETLVRQYDRQENLLNALENGEIDAAMVWNGTNLNDYLLRKYGMEYADHFKDPIDKAKKRNDLEELNAVLGEMYHALLSEKSFAETVDLAITDTGGELRTVEISLISLSSSLHDLHNRRFADFLISPQGRRIMLKHGFLPK